MDPSERSRSLWKATSPLLERTALVADTHVEVCVVGAGIAGLSVAYELARRGLRVVVLDDGPIGGGETAQTTAHLASALDDRFQRLEDLHGAPSAIMRRSELCSISTKAASASAKA